MVSTAKEGDRGSAVLIFEVEGWLDEGVFGGWEGVFMGCELNEGNPVCRIEVQDRLTVLYAEDDAGRSLGVDDLELSELESG